MTTDRQLHVLSAYRLPTSYPLSLSSDETAAWLNGHAALWHPAALAGAAQPPQASNSYDHDSPGAGFLYALPQGPTLFQPDDWSMRVEAAGAVPFHATASRAETVANMKEAMAAKELPFPEYPDDVTRLFAGLGYGYLLTETLFDAMDHVHLLDAGGFWADVMAAVTTIESGEFRDHLKAAAEKLQQAREQLYSGSVHWLDWAFLDPQNLDVAWPESLRRGVPLTLLGSGETLERLAAEQPERFAELRAKFVPDLPSSVDLCCGSYRDREDALMPFESQLWNLRKARRTVKELFGVEPATYGRKKSAYHPQLPSWLQHMGYKHAVLVSFDGALIPSLRGTAANWPGPDGRGVDAFTRDPLPAHDPQSFFNLVYHLHQAISSDAAPTVALAHKGQPAFDSYGDLLALDALAPVLGTWTGLGRYFTDAVTGDYIGSQPADEFFADYLDERVTNEHRPDPVSGFPRHLRLRRRIDSAFTLAALHRSLTPSPGEQEIADLEALSAAEDAIERDGVNESLSPVSLEPLESACAKRLADRIQARAADGQPGVLVFNPCSYTRRAALELDNFRGVIPVADPVKAAEFNGTTARLVVEIPPLGYAWIPRQGNAAVPKQRIKLAEGFTVRNEFFEADVDAATGGLRGMRDLKARGNRFGQQLVYNPGSKMVAREVKVTNSGTALGEVTSSGVLLDEHDRELATFKQRFRAWLGRPVLELKIDLELQHEPTGYPWHSYFAARFGWRDDRAVLFRGVNGANTMTGYTRPVSPDYLEVRFGSERSFLFTGGLPFVQRHGARMADVILVPEGEQTRSFELLLSMDREQPMQTAQGWVSPTPVVQTEKGPPSAGATGWLGHVDMPSLLLTSLRPVGGAPAVVGQFIECAGFGGSSEVQFARSPTSATLVDGMGHELQELMKSGDTTTLDFSAGETLRVKFLWV
ncbi:MAG TPA: hypothetical protein VMZ71_03750 [Gemmataceae bacterium]|nr:hypothetical protein [Gemmataceae bacterium]